MFLISNGNDSRANGLLEGVHEVSDGGGVGSCLLTVLTGGNFMRGPAVRAWRYLG